MLEHCCQDSDCVLTVDKLLRKGGLWWKQPFVWAGHYADKEPGLMIRDEDGGVKGGLRPTNLHEYAEECGVQLPSVTRSESSNHAPRCSRYILNHDKHRFVRRHFHSPRVYVWRPNSPNLSFGRRREWPRWRRLQAAIGLLVDYDKVGIWARDRISVQDTEPTGDFVELKVRFLYE